MKKQISILLIITLLISSFAGCKKAKTNTTTDTSATAAPTAAATAGAAATSTPAADSNVKTTTTADNLKKYEGTEITWSDCQGESGQNTWNKLAEKFKEMTGITVKYTHVAAADYDTWITAQFTAGEEPDIVYDAGLKGSDYFSQKKIIDLTPYYNSVSPFTGDKWVDDYLSSALSGCKDFTGEHYIANTISRATVKFYYNKDLMNQLGLGTEAPKTMSELMDMCKKVKDNGKYTPFSVMNSMSWNLGWLEGEYLEALFHDSGIFEKLNIITPDDKWLDYSEILLGLKTGVISYTDERFVEYWRIMKEFSKYFNQDFNAASWEYEGLFNTGKSVFNVNGGWYPSQVKQNNYTVNYGMSDIPYIDKTCSKYGIDSDFTVKNGGGEAALFVTQKAADEGKAEAAVMFLQFLADKNSGAQIMLDEFLHMPTVKGLKYPDSIANFAEAETASNEDAISLKNYNYAWAFNDEVKAAYWKIYTQYMDPKSTMSAQDFANQVKDTCTPFIDEEIEDRPEYKVEDYISQVQK